MTDLSAQTLRDVEFREKIRGYHPDDVDAFLERVAIGVEALTERLRQAEERASRTEQQLSEAVTDETLRRTLVLAQRTADLAVAEAKELADRLLYDARRDAEVMVADARAAARHVEEEADERARAEVTRLERARGLLMEDVLALQAYVERNRATVRELLGEQMRQFEQTVLRLESPPAMLAPASEAAAVAATPEPPPPWQGSAEAQGVVSIAGAERAGAFPDPGATPTPPPVPSVAQPPFAPPPLLPVSAPEARAEPGVEPSAPQTTPTTPEARALIDTGSTGAVRPAADEMFARGSGRESLLSPDAATSADPFLAELRRAVEADDAADPGQIAGYTPEGSDPPAEAERPGSRLFRRH